LIEFSSEILDIQAYEARRFLPATLVPRSGSDLWLVREEPAGSTKHGVSWSYASEGPQVRIPLMPYLSNGHDPTQAIGYAYQLGLRIAFESMPIIVGKEVLRVHVAVGHPVIDMAATGGPQAFKFWLGVGIKIKG
jgi:hypothetical protein